MYEMFQLLELIYDENGKVIDYIYLDVNPAFERLTGKTKEQLVGHRVKDIFGVVEDYWLRTYEESRDRGANHLRELRCGARQVLRDQAWKVGEKQVTMTFKDITDRKRSENVLKENEDRYRTLFNAIDEGFYLIDVIFDENDTPVDLCYVMSNPAANRMTGTDFTGPRLRDIAPYEPYSYEIFGRVARTGESVAFGAIRRAGQEVVLVLRVQGSR